MKIRNSILPILLFFLSAVFFEKAFQAASQLQFRWKFATLMLVTGCVIIAMAVFIWRNASLQACWYSRRLQTGFLLAGLILAAGGAFLPQRVVDYINLPEVDPGAGAPISGPLKLPPGAVVDLPDGQKTLLDWLRDFSSPEIKQFQGQEIDVTGFVAYSTRTPLGQFSINRMTLTCCIPDPVPVGLPVEWHTGSRLAEDTWVRVKGTINIVEINGTGYPEILAQQIDLINKPLQPYLFPK